MHSTPFSVSFRHISSRSDGRSANGLSTSLRVSRGNEALDGLDVSKTPRNVSFLRKIKAAPRAPLADEHEADRCCPVIGGVAKAQFQDGKGGWRQQGNVQMGRQVSRCWRVGDGSVSRHRRFERVVRADAINAELRFGCCIEAEE